jgi:hypothetical protein
VSQEEGRRLEICGGFEKHKTVPPSMLVAGDTADWMIYMWGFWRMLNVEMFLPKRR